MNKVKNDSAKRKLNFAQITKPLEEAAPAFTWMTVFAVSNTLIKEYTCKP